MVNNNAKEILLDDISTSPIEYLCEHSWQIDLPAKYTKNIAESLVYWLQNKLAKSQGSTPFVEIKESPIDAKGGTIPAYGIYLSAGDQETLESLQESIKKSELSV